MNTTSNEFRADVENHLFGLGEPTLLDADELDVVNDFALQEFGASACAAYIRAQRRARYW